jgi:hypothetical protein
MPTPLFSLESVKTHCETDDTGKFIQWAEITLLIPKDFDFQNSAKLLKTLQFAVGLIGRGDA